MMSGKVTIPIPEWLDRIFTRPVLLYRLMKYGSCFRVIDLGEGECAIVDSQDYYRIRHFNWYLFGNAGKFYANRNKKTEDGTKIISMHRELLNAPPGMLVDHWNSDGLDNRGENTRLATYSQNVRNRRKTNSRTTSKYIGVSWDAKRGMWTAAMRINGKVKFLGRFYIEEDAAKARDEAARKHFGEDAYLNFGEPRRRPRVEMLRAREAYAKTGLPACLLPIWKTGELAGLLIK